MPPSSPAHEPTSLVPRRERMGLASAISLALHGLLFVGMLTSSALSSCQGAQKIDQRPIAARLVRQGTPRPDHLLPRIPTAPATAPAPKEAPIATPGETTPPPKPTPEPPPPATPKETSVPSPAAAAPSSPPKPAAPQAEAPKPPPDSKQRLDDIMQRFAAGAREGPAEAPVGQLDGDPFGDSDTAAEGDRYLALVRQRLQAQYSVPSAIPESERIHLVAHVQLLVERNGSISQFRIVKASGNALFDSALEAAVQRASPLPPPPSHLAGKSIIVNYRL